MCTQALAAQQGCRTARGGSGPPCKALRAGLGPADGHNCHVGADMTSGRAIRGPGPSLGAPGRPQRHQQGPGRAWVAPPKSPPADLPLTRPAGGAHEKKPQPWLHKTGWAGCSRLSEGSEGLPCVMALAGPAGRIPGARRRAWLRCDTRPCFQNSLRPHSRAQEAALLIEPTQLAQLCCPILTRGLISV